MKKTLTIPEAADRLGWTVRATWQAVYRKRLPHRRLGRKVFVLVDELDSFLRGLPGVTSAEALTAVERSSSPLQ